MNPIPAGAVVTSDACRRVAFPLERRLVLDTLRLGLHKPMMHGLLEVDVTRARDLLRDLLARTGERLSFTAFVLACVGRGRWRPILRFMRCATGSGEASFSRTSTSRP